MIELSIAEASDLLRRRQISPVELTTSCLVRIEQLNPTINAFITVMHHSALAQAREAESEIHAGNWRGPLHGIPIGLKDLIDTAGVKTTCGSALFKDRVPTEDAEIVRRLKSAGVVLIGKQNMQEFAYGGTSTSSYFGPVHNPWDVDRIAGGSSGGSAAAVATGMCFGAIGTDTGGSVRRAFEILHRISRAVWTLDSRAIETSGGGGHSKPDKSSIDCEVLLKTCFRKSTCWLHQQRQCRQSQ